MKISIFLIIISLFGSPVFSQDTTGTVIMLSEKTGPVLDLEERNFYRLFLMYEHFESAVLLQYTDSTYIFKIITKEKSDAPAKIHWKPISKEMIKRIRYHIETYGVIITKSPARTELLPKKPRSYANSRISYGFKGGIGIGNGGTTIGGLQSNKFGIILNLRFEINKFVFDFDLQPFKIENPCRDEAFISLYMLPSLQFGKNQYLRPALGVAIRWWSGTDVWINSDIGPAIGLTFGFKLQLTKKFSLTPEMIWRASIGDEISTSLFGIQFITSG